MANVIVIPANDAEPKTLRVAAYCRVSSDSADQLHSYAAQIRNYTEVIEQHENWELIDVYADEGLTGTRMDKRDDFNRMLNDCRRGKIDLILVKSISRFARNTYDCLSVLRELSSLGVSVRFEKENINTETLTTEMMVSVYSALAQEESISISQNQRMSYQRRMQRGEFITCKPPFGYRMPDGKNLEAIPEEAEIVRWIYEAYLNGKSSDKIAKELTERNVPTTDGKPFWRQNAVVYILTNEKYVGDTLCHKKYSTDFPFKKKLNCGEKEQYYVEQSHPAIITRETFQRAQSLRKMRSERKSYPGKKYPLTLKVRCGNCGSVCSRRVTSAGRAYWVCRTHDRTASECAVGRISEDGIYDAFTRMSEKLRANIETVLQPAVSQLGCLNDTLMKSNPAILEVNRAIAEANERLHKINLLAAKGLMSGDVLTTKLRDVSVRLTELRGQRRRILQNSDVENAEYALRKLIDALRREPQEPTQFDESLFAEITERIIIESESRVRIRLYGGVELPESLEAEA